MKVETFLPVFPGFYETIFDLDTENFIYSENQDNTHGFEIDYDDLKIDRDEYKTSMAKNCVNFVERELIELGFVKSIKYQSIQSPREYNFSTDSINIEIQMTKKNVANLLRYLKSNWEGFTAHIKEHYTSRSGFISHHSNNAKEWLAETSNLSDADSLRHKLGAILDYVFECEYEDSNFLMYEYCRENVYEYEFIEVINRAGQVLLNEVFGTDNFRPEQVNFEAVENGLQMKADIIEIFNSKEDDLEYLDFDPKERAIEIYELVKNVFTSPAESEANYKLNL